MRQLTTDKVSAIVGPQTSLDQAGAGYKLALAAGVPVVGSKGLSPSEFNSTGIFPLSSGIPGWVYGAVYNLLKSGASKIVVLTGSEPGADFLAQQAIAALKVAGTEPVRVVAGNNQSDPTFAGAAAKVATGDVDGVLLLTNPLYVPKAVRSLRQLGFTGTISSITPIFPGATITALGSLAEGILLTSQVALSTDLSNPAVVQFQDDMKRYQPDAAITESTVSSWAAVQLLKSVLETIGPDYTAAAVQAAFQNLATPVGIGIIGPYQVKGGTKESLPGFPDIYNPTVQNGKIDGGKVVAVAGEGLINPFTSLASLASGG